MFIRAFLALCLMTSLALAADPNSNWPNGPDDDPQDAMPNDPNYVKRDSKGNIVGGQWNLWSFVPEKWTKTSGFRKEEIAMGTGIHADRAWQRTTGDRRVIIAVLDSGIKWNETSLLSKHYLNKNELTNCKPEPLDPPASDDEWDVNGDGVFNIDDYAPRGSEKAKAMDEKGNKNNVLDPGDLIRTCSDGKDDDDNGFVDDISGWDTMWNDNDPYDDTRYGHGTGESRDSGAAGNDGHGDIGVCPNCTIMNVRVGDSFVVDVNDFAAGVIFATDTGAHVIQEALGSVNNTPYAMSAIEYAYLNNTVVIASAADELSFHHNAPGTNNHTVYVHAILHDNSKIGKSTTFLNFNNCTNFGGQLLLSTPGSGCSSEATGISAGHAGLIYSAAFKANLKPELSSEEVRQIMIQSADDINVPESKDDPTKFISGPGWDLHFGYGRNNARTSVDMVLDDRIPPEADIAAPLWFEPIEVNQRPKVAITGRVGARVDGEKARYDNYEWVLEWAPGVAPSDGWTEIATGTEMTGGAEPATLHEWDVSKASERYDYTVPLTDPHQYAATIRLKVLTKHDGVTLKGEFRKTVHLFKDDTLLKGFPKYLGTSAESSPKILDIDGEPGEEIIVATSDGAIHAFKDDGTEAAGWPTYMNLRTELDPDGPNIRNACAFRAEADKKNCETQGTINTEIGRQTTMGSVAVGALTGNEKDLSVVSLSWDGYVYVFDSIGQIREGWPQRTNPEHSAETNPNATLDEGFFAAPVLADMDGDGDLEIIAAAMDQYVYIWHHDGSPLKGWPVLVKNPVETQRARIIATPAVGDVDGDGHLELAVNTNEVYGDNESASYLLKHTGSEDKDDVKSALAGDGWPVTTFGVTVNTLPLVGRGGPTNPLMADLTGDGKLELQIDAIAFRPNLYYANGEPYETIMDTQNFGPLSTSVDSPVLTLMNNGTFARLDPNDSIDLIKGTAGFDFALTFVEGGQRAYFDHQLSAWDTKTGNMLTGFPVVVDDWQFFMNPTVVDLDGDNLPEVLNGTGGYLLHAYNYKGVEPKGFPKMLGSWIISSPAFGDLTNNNHFEVVNMTRAGWMFAWRTPGPVSGRIEWQTYGHDAHNTNNYESKVAMYNQYPEAKDIKSLCKEDPFYCIEGQPVGEESDDDDSGCRVSSTGSPVNGLILLLVVGLLIGFRRLRPYSV